LRICRHLLGEAGADDAFQATFLLLARSAGHLTRPGSLAGWLHATAIRIARNAQRGERRRKQPEAARLSAPSALDQVTRGGVREPVDREDGCPPGRSPRPTVPVPPQEKSQGGAAPRAGLLARGAARAPGTRKGTAPHPSRSVRSAPGPAGSRPRCATAGPRGD